MGVYSTNITAPKGNSGMTSVSSHNDDTTVKFPNIGFDFFYNGVNCRITVNSSGNSWLGLTGANEQLKINRRDAGADNIYYTKEIEKIPNTGTNSFENPTLGTTNLTLENNKSYAFIPQQDQGKAYTVLEGSYIQTSIKYLIVDGNDIKQWNIASSSYVKVSELPLTADKFQTYGDDTYHKERTGITSSAPSLKIWSPLTEMPAPKVTQTIKPRTIIVNMKDDILFSESYIKDIMNAVVALDNTGGGIIAFIVSIDSGVSWKAWNGNSWVLVDISNIQDVKSKGMSVAVLQGITEAQWTSLGLSNEKIRFAWYMEITVSTDALKLK
jgi:hypothetical protein